MTYQRIGHHEAEVLGARTRAQGRGLDLLADLVKVDLAVRELQGLAVLGERHDVHVEDSFVEIDWSRRYRRP